MIFFPCRADFIFNQKVVGYLPNIYATIAPMGTYFGNTYSNQIGWVHHVFCLHLPVYQILK